MTETVSEYEGGGVSLENSNLTPTNSALLVATTTRSVPSHQLTNSIANAYDGVLTMRGPFQ
jgi:hypothetical protein